VVSKKYLKDYRLEEQVGSNGRIKTKAVYIGGEYRLTPETSTREKRLILSLTAIPCLSLIGALIPVTQAARTIYVIMPFMFSALPIYLMITTAINYCRTKEPMKREQAERIAARMPAGALITIILNTAAFIGMVMTAAISWGSFPAGDIIFGTLAIIIAASSAVILSKTRKLKPAPAI